MCPACPPACLERLGDIHAEAQEIIQGRDSKRGKQEGNPGNKSWKGIQDSNPREESARGVQERSPEDSRRVIVNNSRKGILGNSPGKDERNPRKESKKGVQEKTPTLREVELDKRSTTTIFVCCSPTCDFLVLLCCSVAAPLAAPLLLL